MRRRTDCIAPVNNSLRKNRSQAIVTLGIDVCCKRRLWYRAETRTAPVTDSQHDPKSPRPRMRRLAIRRYAQRRHFRFYSRWSGWTFLQNVSASPLTWRAEHWILGGVALVLTAMVGIVIPTFAKATRHDAGTAYTTLAIELPALPEGEEADPAIGAWGADGEPNWRIVRVQAGQTLSDIFKAQGIGADVLHRVLDSQKDASALRYIRPGQEFAFAFDADGALTAFRFDRGDAERVVLRAEGRQFVESVEDRSIERRTHVAHGVVTSSLFYAGEQAGLSDAIVLKLADAFGYDIDFAQDLRVGDSFSVIYDDIYREGERLRDGEIIAATFINQGKRYTAVRYVDGDGKVSYFDEKGRPLRKSFLRTPVEFTRISSLFSTGRKHPILGKMRAHKGVDYAAPTGTPIRAAGDGKIVFRGWKSGYGNFVMIQHNKSITTAYGHMSRFAGIKVGDRVRQGQTIGYVGKTGLATGPHLHYEFRVDGKHRNPLTVTLPPPEPLPASQLAAFRKATAPLLARLEYLDSRRLARAGD